MKKLFIGLFLTAAVAASVSAVDWKEYPDAIQPGAWMISAGIGYGTPQFGDTVVPPITFNVDYALPIDLPITLGALFGVTTSEYKWSSAIMGNTYGYTLNFTGIAFGAAGAYHPNFGVKNLDAYAKLALGYYVFTGEAEFFGTNAGSGSEPVLDYSTVYYGFSVGGRYFFTQVIGAYLELAYSPLAYATIGATFKIGGGSGGGSSGGGAGRRR